MNKETDAMKIKKISPILLTILSSFLLSITNSEVHAWPWNRWGSDQNVRRDGAPPPPPESKSKSPSPESTNESSTPEIDPLEELKLVIDEIENDLRQMGYESSQLSEILHEIRYIQSYLQMNDRPLTVAIHGDGNSGKSTLFNLLYGRSAMTVEASLGTTPETGLGLPGNIDRDDVLFEQILRHKKTGGLGAARLFGAAGAWTKVFGNYQESPEWVLLDSPSYTRAEFSFMLDEISQLSDVALAMVPRDYLSDDFLHFIRTWSAKGKSIALVFNERDPNFAKIDAKTAQSIAREISKATGAKDLGQFKLTQAGENEAPQFSLLNSNPPTTITNMHCDHHY